MFAVDPTLHWANPNNVPSPSPPFIVPFPPGYPAAQADVPLVTHLHGAEVYSGKEAQQEKKSWCSFFILRQDLMAILRPGRRQKLGLSNLTSFH
jgi:hypothetical protein